MRWARKVFEYQRIVQVRRNNERVYGGSARTEIFTYVSYSRCRCEPGKCGTDCNLTDPCLEAVCVNGGVCLEMCTTEASFMCNCTEGFTGTNCSEVVSYFYYYLNSIYSTLAYPFS